MTIEDQIKAAEDEIQRTPYNKNTQHHIGKLKAKVARLKEELQLRQLKGGGGGPGYAVKKSGHATVGLVGFPSVGKSTLLNQITDATSAVAAYDFTTLTVIPGGLTWNPTVKLTLIDEETLADVCRERGVPNGTVVVREDVTADRLIDVLAGNRNFMPALVVLNKIDLVTPEYLKTVEGRLKGWRILPISAMNGAGLEPVRAEVYNSLRFMRVYLKPQGKEADLREPLIVREGSTVGEVCDAIHRDIRKKFRYANVWGESAVFPGQKVGLNHGLREGDVVTIVARKQ